MTDTVDHDTSRAALRARLLAKRLSGTATRARDEITPAPRGGVLPTSFAQRRLWILDQLQPGGTEYLLTFGLRLRGALSKEAVRRALDGLAARHEVLRTRYTVVDGEPVQVIDPPGPVELSVVDITGLCAAEQDERLGELSTSDRTPVDLVAGPVFRAVLAILGPDHHALLVTTHHIATDGWSEDVLAREFGALYQGETLPEIPLQYADYAVWERESLPVDRSLDFWRSTLSGLSPLQLPTDRPHPPVRDHAGAEVTFTVPADVSAAVIRHARSLGATPYMALLAAFKIVLARYTGGTDIAVGTPVAGRERREVQDLVGLFLNTLVLRTDLSGDPTFTDVLSRVRATALDAYAHQDLPFERVVDALSPDRDPSRTPLFSVMFLSQVGAEASATAIGGLLAEPIHVGESSAKFDLSVAVAERADGTLAVALDYATALFDRDTIERLAGHFGALLAAVAANPATPISALDLMTAGEKDRLAEWNDTATAYPEATLPALFAAQVSHTPDAPAVRFEGTELTYAELDARANQVAHYLRSHGVGPESVVGVRLHRGHDLVAALLGVLKAGGAYLPLDPDYPADRLDFMVGDSRAALVIDEAIDVSGFPLSAVDPGTTPGSAAYVIYTSGSTGRPKGVLVDHRGIVNRLQWMQSAYGLDATDRVLQKTPYSFDVSVWEFFWPLTTGATLVVARPGGHRDPAYLASLIDDERITTLHFVPSMLRAFLTEPFTGLPSVRRMICSGEALPADLVTAAHERIGCELHNLYGPTEASVDVTAVQTHPGEPVTIGKPIANTRTHIVDRDLNPVPVGVPGELLLAGVQLARGYLGRPDLTAERFIPDPFGGSGERLYRTGDLARFRADGQIEYLGRLDHQVKVNGHRIELGEIEATLTAHPGVTDAAVTVRDGGLVAYVVGDADETVLRAHLRERLPESMVPARWVALPALPLTGSGKTDRKALPAPQSRRSALTVAYVPPSSPTEHAIAHAFADALGIDEIGVHDSFFQLGGDSMRAIRVVGALREHGFSLAVHDLFTHQSIAALAALVGDPGAALADEPLVERFGQLTPADRDLLPAGLVDAYPLARTQAGMVYEMLAANDRAVYQNVSCYRVHDESPFSFAALREAARILVDRHEILRTSFDLANFSETLQLVHERADLPIGFDDLRDADPATQRSIVDTFLVAERSRPFDLDRAPLLRYHVHQISDGEWWLTHTECHAILDGWSHTSVVAEFIALYKTIRRGERPELAPPPEVRFADFVAMERAALESAEDREFWRSKIGSADRFELPEAWASDVHSDKATIIDVPWADLLPRLRALASAANASLKSVLHSAHLTALRVVTGRERFFGGLVCNGRPERARGDEVFGMYLNTVPYAADLSARSWRALVGQVFAGEAELWPHRRYPMPAMQQEWSRSAELIEVAFGYLDFHVLDWKADSVGMVDDFSPSELGLEVWTFPGVLRLGARESRIARPHLDMLGRTYRRVLEAMAADPDGDPHAVTLHPVDLDLALRDDSRRVYPTDRLAHELIAAQAVSTPDAVALRRGADTETDIVTFRELDDEANRIAHWLRDRGVGPDVIVALRLPRGPELVTAMLAVLKAGGAFLPVDPDYPADRIAYMLEDSGTALVIDSPIDAAELPPTAPQTLVLPDNLAYVIYTSGSTGRPKGVGVPHRGALNLRHAQREHLDVRPGDAVLQFASPSFDASVWELLMALTNGAALVLPPADADPGDLRTQAGVVTHMTLPPSILDKLEPADFPALRVLVSAGEACPREQAVRWAAHARFINAYGPTETSVCATLTDVPADIAGSPSIGGPIGNVRVHVLDEKHRPVPLGVPGELCVGGQALARGYLNRPDLTADRFIPDPFGGPGERLYRTGDIVTRGLDGELRYRGRRDNQVKVRGFRIELGEVEAALTAHPEVAAAVVTVHNQTLVAYTRPAPGPGAAELREHLRGHLPAHLLPSQYIALDDFPLTPAGKIDRVALPAPESTRPEEAATYVEPRTDMERTIAAAWADALGVERVGVEDDFFDLGGHSLAMMRIIAALRVRHGVELRFRSFVEHRTVAGLARTIESTAPRAATSNALLWIREGGTGTPLVCVHPGGGSAHWYMKLAPHVREDVPIIGFEWPGPHDGATPTAEEMAERYVAELRRTQPAGPYRLFSWCGGSCVTTEMAHRLRSAGEEVTLILLDPGLDVHTRTEGWSEFGLIKRLEDLLTGPDPDLPERRAEILALLEHLVDDVDPDTGITLPEQGVGDVWPRAVRIWREVMEMDLRYRHRPYPGELHLIASDELTKGEHEVSVGQTFDDYLTRWRELTDGVHVHQVPGDHFGVMRPPNVSLLGAAISGVL
ncbi:non-ribosomal peptide synthetase [Actinokineospora xionganensis]|uniref:Amino acid adenylation domain-containing protein n=1 Tax=Actinokineospora xionganensis TaxID=2684470 RepID=A0ABR7LC39_9PSEU|nr:non-ribosomal peptide synthetase [Actinokineospora xionganensis]MBC6450153.1 amino acid adenylation domain-containing protein [Actinokineospora xionganensis]